VKEQDDPEVPTPAAVEQKPAATAQSVGSQREQEKSTDQR